MLLPNLSRIFLVLLSGTAAAQLVTFLSAPVLTRMYSPADYGGFGIYSAIISILSVFATARYDLAIIEPEDHGEAVKIMSVAIRINLFYCFFVLLCAVLATGVFESAPRLHDQSALFVLLIPVSVFLTSCAAVFSSWLNRTQQFSTLSLSKFIMASVSVGLSVVFGALGFQAGGLILAYLIGALVAVAYQWYRGVAKDFKYRIPDVKRILRKYSSYPKFLLPSTLMSSLSSDLQVILISKVFGQQSAGHFSFANRVAVAPANLIGSSVSEVFKVVANQQFYKNGHCRGVFLKFFFSLAALGALPAAVLFWFGPDLFAAVFGESWRQSGEIAMYLGLLIWCQMISSPLTHVIAFNASFKLDLYLQLYRVIGASAAILLGLIEEDLGMSVKLYVGVYCSYYLAHSLIQYRAVGGRV